MRYDMAVKRAERLLRKNWDAVRREAHRLAALGLRVEVADDHVVVASSRHITPYAPYPLHSVRIWADGRVERAGKPKGYVEWVLWSRNDWGGRHPYPDYSRPTQAVAKALELALAEREAEAEGLGEAAQLMAKVG